MSAYLSKSEDETSEAMKQAAKDSLNTNKTNIEQMRSISRAYQTKRECSIQEAVYLATRWREKKIMIIIKYVFALFL